MPEYQDYPAWMNNPAMRQAVVDPQNPRNNQPVVYPPVIVNSADQQAEYEAKGYRRSSAPNPAAFQTLTSAPTSANYEPAEYPKWVCGVIVNSADEEKALNEKPARRRA